MARSYVFSTDLKLYHPAEPEGRVFPAGSTDPGAAWSDTPGGDRSESKSVAGMAKDLIEASDRADALAATVSRNASDLAEMGKVRDDAVAKAGALEQRVVDAERLRDQAQALAESATKERDTARAEVERRGGLLTKVEKERDDAIAAAELYAEEVQKLGEANAALTAQVAKFDGDGDGKVGGKARATKLEAEPA